MVGEIGGSAEEDAAAFIMSEGDQTVVGFVAGLSAPLAAHGACRRHRQRRQRHGPVEDPVMKGSGHSCV